MRVHFNLRDKNAAKKTSIFLVARHFGKNLRYSTGLSISPTLWDIKRNRPKSGQLPHVRVKLNQLEEKAEKALMEAGYLSQSEFKDLMDKVTGKVESSGKTPYLLSFIRDYCEDNKRLVLRSAATILVNFTLGATYSRWGLIDWDKIKGRDVRFDSIDWSWRQRFYNYCVGQNLAASYIEAMLFSVSHFLNASRPTHHTNEINKVRGWSSTKNAKTKHTPITLTIDEIKRLAGLGGLSDLDTKVKDLFLIGIMSGQRFSDYSSIKPNQVKDGRVHFLQQKTKVKTAIPFDLWAGLVPETLGEILERYGNSSPTISDKNPDAILNERVKFLCRRAGITGQVEVISTVGDDANLTYCEKWQVVSSHTARRTFATVWHRGKMSLASIALFTGHKSVNQLKTYIGLTNEEHQQAAEREAETARAVLLAKAI